MNAYRSVKYSAPVVIMGVTKMVGIRSQNANRVILKCTHVICIITAFSLFSVMAWNLAISCSFVFVFICLTTQKVTQILHCQVIGNRR
jgi:hypothetical protein